MSTIDEKVINDELDAAWALLPDAHPGDRLSEAISSAIEKARADGRESLRMEVWDVLHTKQRDLVSLVATVVALLESLAPVVGAEGGEQARNDDPLPVATAEPGPDGVSDGPARASTEDER